MLYYRFAIQRNSKIENLGGLTMADDAEAIEFGKLVVQDLIKRHSEQHAGWTMEITERGRAVFSVDFESEGPPDSNKRGWGVGGLTDVSEFNDHAFRVLALRAFEGPEIEPRFIRLNPREKHSRGAFWAPRPIIHIWVCRRVLK